MFDGLMFHSGFFGQLVEAVDLIHSYGVPCVVLGQCLNPKISQIHFDLKANAKEMTNHLFSQGHHQIACIYNVPNDPRIDGYSQACLQHNIKVDPKLIIEVDLAKTQFDDLAKHILALGATAVYATTDVIAAKLLEAFNSMGVEIPEKIALCCHGDHQYCKLFNPPLTAFSHPTDQIVKPLVKLLLKKMNNPDSAPETVILTGKLIPRASTLGRVQKTFT